MANQQVLEGNWNEVKGRIRSKWGQLNENELDQAKGKTEELVGVIQRKTGESREAIERFLDEASAEGGARMAQATAAARQYTHQASDAVQRASQRMAESFTHGYDEAEHYVRDRPAETLATCFGAGLITGVVVGMLLRSSR